MEERRRQSQASLLSGQLSVPSRRRSRIRPRGPVNGICLGHAVLYTIPRGSDTGVKTHAAALADVVERDNRREKETSAAIIARLAKTPNRTATEPAQIDWKAVTDAVYNGNVREHLGGLLDQHFGLTIADIDRGPKPDAVSLALMYQKPAELTRPTLTAPFSPPHRPFTPHQLPIEVRCVSALCSALPSFDLVRQFNGKGLVDGHNERSTAIVTRYFQRRMTDHPFVGGSHFIGAWLKRVQHGEGTQQLDKILEGTYPVAAEFAACGSLRGGDKESLG